MSARILIVDDSPTIRHLLAMLVRQLGYEAFMAEDGLQGLEEIERRNPDLVMTDVNMPNMDGFTLISRIRANQAWHDIPIIVLSTERNARDRAIGQKSGADMYLVKPVSAETLAKALNELLTTKGRPGPGAA